MLEQLVLPRTEMQSGEMLRCRLEKFVGVSLVLAVFRHAEVADTSTGFRMNEGRMIAATWCPHVRQSFCRKQSCPRRWFRGFAQVMCGMYLAHVGISRVDSGRWASMMKHSTTMNTRQRMYHSPQSKQSALAIRCATDWRELMAFTVDLNRCASSHCLADQAISFVMAILRTKPMTDGPVASIVILAARHSMVSAYEGNWHAQAVRCRPP